MAKNGIMRKFALIIVSLIVVIFCYSCGKTDVPSNEANGDSSAQTARISAENLQMLLGDIQTLTITGAEGNVEWATRNSSVATVENGTVTATGLGETWIVASFSNGELYCRITVDVENVAVPTIWLIGEIKTQSGYELNVIVGEKYTLNPKLIVGEETPSVGFVLTASDGIEIDGLSFIVRESIEKGKIIVSCQFEGKTYSLEITLSSAEV